MYTHNILIAILGILLVCLFFYLIQDKNTKPIIKLNAANAEPIPNAEPVLNNLLENFTEQSIIDLARLYMFGMLPTISPNRTEAGKICHLILNDHRFSPVARQHARELFSELRYDGNDIGGENILPPIADYIANNGSEKLERMKAIQMPPRQTTTTTTTTTTILDDQEDMMDEHWYMLDMPFQNILDNDFNIYDYLNINQSPPPPRPINDSQNVHGSAVQNAAKQKLQTIQHSSNNNNSTDFIKYLENHSSQQNAAAIRVYESLSSSIHSKYDKSEQDVFKSVWERINASENQDRRDEMASVFIANLASGIERDSIVCSTGKIMRMIGSLDAMDANHELAQPLQPEWAIDTEMATAAAKIRADTLASATTEQVATYESSQTNDQLAIQMKTQLEQKLRTDYKGLVTDEMLTLKIDELSEYF